MACVHRWKVDRHPERPSAPWSTVVPPHELVTAIVDSGDFLRFAACLFYASMSVSGRSKKGAAAAAKAEVDEVARIRDIDVGKVKCSTLSLDLGQRSCYVNKSQVATTHQHIVWLFAFGYMCVCDLLVKRSLGPRFKNALFGKAASVAGTCYTRRIPCPDSGLRAAHSSVSPKRARNTALTD